MLSYEEFRDALFAAAKAQNAEAETYCVEDESFDVHIDKQEVDSYTVARGKGLGLRVQKDGHDGYAYTENFEEPEELVKKALDNASIISTADEHPMNGAQTYETLTEKDNPTLKLSEAEKIELAKRLEREALSADPRVRRVQTAAVVTAHSVVRLANTQGLRAQQRESMSYCFVSPILEENGEVHNEGAFRIDAETLNVADCAQEAVKRAAEQFGGEPIASGKYRILFTGEALADLLSAFSPMFSAEAAQKGLSVLANKEGKTVCGENISITDDPLYPKYPRTFDAEGTPSQATAVIENGVLKSFLHNLKTAKKAGTVSTSNASRHSAASPVGIAPSQLYIAAGDKSRDELLAMMGDGILIRDVSGLHAGVNAVSGEFSLLSKGALVENGKITKAVERITVSGSFLGMLSEVLGVGKELQFTLPSGSVCAAPDLLVAPLMVAGK